MVSFRHVLFSERDRVAELHPELAVQCPNFVTPYLAEATSYPAEFPYAFYAIEEGVVASRINSFCDTALVEGKKYAWAWNANLFTNSAFRGRGLAEQIINYQLDEFSKRQVVWGGTFSSDPALRLYHKLGFTIVGSAPRMCLLRRPYAFLTHHIGGKAAARLLSALYQGGYSAAGALLFHQRSFGRGYSIEQIDPDQLAKIERDQSIQYGRLAHWENDAELLKAKMRVRGSDSIALVRDSSGRPLFFFLWRVRKTAERPIKEKYLGVRMFSVMDFCWLSEERAADALIQAVIAVFQKSSADLLEFVTSSPDVERSARSHGFLPLGSGMSFTFKAPAGHALEKLKSKVADWHLTHYSGDGFSFE